MAKDNYKKITASHKLKYDERKDCYDIQLVHRRFPWWILLLLLPLLLLIRCEKDVEVTCLEPDGKTPVAGIPVTMEYTAHFLWADGTLLLDKDIKKVQKTDDKGKTTFKDLPCSVYSYIFYCLSNAKYTAKNNCYAAAGEEHNFHYKSNVTLIMKPRREDLHVKIVDLETGDLLPGASLVYKYTEKGEEKTDSAKADASGVATLPNMRYCAVIEKMTAGCYGYADTSRVDVPCQDLLVANDSTAMRLRPVKEKFTFFVKNKETRQPIPDAECTVTLTRPTGTKSPARIVRTSIDGKGIAMYDNAFVLSTIDITAKKTNYADGQLEGGPWTVEKFIKQKDDVRTIWLKPVPYLMEYVNVDSITGKPISGVTNRIKITTPAGKVTNITEMSNSNGVFPVTAQENSRIEIVSEKSPVYKVKTTVIAKFKGKEVIRMSPNMTTVTLRTTNMQTSQLLPGCTLSITGSASGSLQPTNSGNGQFSVTARVDESISIRASKSGYASNSSTVNNTPMSSLKNGRDIPLKPDPVVYVNSDSYKGIGKNCYDLKEENATFEFSWSLCPVCTMLVVSDSNGNILGRYGINSPNGDGKGVTFSPSQGKVTLKCPTQEVCVTRTDVNGDPCNYRIEKK